MEITINKSQEINRPKIQKRVYQAKFKGINDKDIPDGEYGKRVAFIFELVEKDYEGIELSTVANARYTPNTRAGKFLSAMLGRAIEPEEKINIDSLVGKVYEVLTDNLVNDYGEYSVIKEIIREVKEGSK